MPYRKHLLWVIIGLAVATAELLAPNTVISGFQWLSNVSMALISTHAFRVAAVLVAVLALTAWLSTELRRWY